MEAKLPANLLQDNSGCNQLVVGPFNSESEISHTARSSSDSCTDYDGGPRATATATISDPTEPGANDPLRPLSSHLQPTWAPQPERKCGDHGGGDHACAPAPVDLAALSAASRTAEDPKRALVHALKNDVSRLLVRLERLDELLSA